MSTENVECSSSLLFTQGISDRERRAHYGLSILLFPWAGMRAFHHQSTLARCGVCGLHVPLCMCDRMSPEPVTTRVTLIMHIKESRRTSNTGHLIPLTVQGAEVRLRGQKDAMLRTDGLCVPQFESVLLFPCEDAEVLDQDWAARRRKPVHLIVPDGNWRQAKRMSYREPILAELPRVKLAGGLPSRYRLRRHPDPHFMSTFEAVSRALGVLDGPDIQTRLDATFDCFVERSLWARGELSASAVTGGIPPIRPI